MVQNKLNYKTKGKRRSRLERWGNLRSLTRKNTIKQKILR